MKCPRCEQKIHRGAGECPHCAFSITTVDAVYAGIPRRMRLLNDSGGLMRRHERERVEEALDRFSRRFPQLFAAVYTGGAKDENLRMLGFWLLNRAQYADLREGISNSDGVLITLDADAKQAGISFGYRLDAWLNEQDTFDCLARAHAYFLENRYAEGVCKALDQLTTVLIKRSRQAKRNLPPRRNPEAWS